jgi:RNA polymerase sigma-70 factor (ECF subfamily)
VPIFDAQPQLLPRFRAGERAALAQVYAFYFDEVYRLLRFGFRLEAGVVPPLDEAVVLDTVQETFVRAFDLAGRTGFDGQRPYRPYLLRIARNLRIDQLRKTRRELALLDAQREAVMTQLEPEPPSAEERAHAQALQSATAEYIATLDPEARQFVALRFEQALSQRDIADRMGATRRRIRTLEDQVQRGLVELLGKKGLG